ncbi:MAG TPA: PDZ domain-containing protein, partial [Acidimicrobiales bacterium]|nr:PDZ domain-containing protein [Acidimicrobiales bacterium]
VVGINTHRVDDGFYLAQPADAGLRDRLTALGRGEVPFRPRLGVAVVPGHVARRLRAAVGLEPRDGLLVRAVEEGGPADRAGVRGGDLIVEVGGAAVTSPDDLHRALESAVSGAMAVTLIRGSDEVTVSVDLSGGGARQEGSA